MELVITKVSIITFQLPFNGMLSVERQLGVQSHDVQI